MSKIMQELLTATGLKTERGESDQDFLKRLVHAVHNLDDKGWDALSTNAQSWFNDAADAKNAKQDIPGFPDEVKEETTTRRRQAEPETDVAPRRRAAEPEAYEPRLKDEVDIVTKRGTAVSGVIVELDKDILVVKDGKGEELEIQRSRIESIKLQGSTSAAEEDKDPMVGDVVIVTTKRGAVYEGKLIELDKEGGCLIDKDGKEQEFNFDRVDTFKLASAKGGGETSSRRTRSAEPEPEPRARGSDKKDDDKNTKVTKADNKGISATGRMRELILDDLEAKQDDIGKAMRKEGLMFKDNTLQLVYTDTHRLVKMMRERKMLK